MQAIARPDHSAELDERKNVFLSNGVTSVLENSGSIIWFPCPKFDSPSVFSRILDDRRGGYFSITPESEHRLNTHYFRDTLVVENIFSSSEGNLKVTDFMPVGLSAVIRIFESEVPFIADIKPLFNYGMINPSMEDVEGGIIFRNNHSKEGLEVSIEGKYSYVDEGVLSFGPGKGYLFTMYSRDLRYGLFSNKGFVFPNPYDALDKSIRFWTSQVSRARKVSKFSEIYNRSILVALGLTYASSGGIIAAPTTSIPEIVGHSRNWDYRYVWIRDASYAVEALVAAGLSAKAKRILDFLLSVMDPSSKSFDHPLYSIDGTPPPPEETLGWLSGNRNSRPVRIGNSAYMQVQTDTEGDFMSALYSYVEATGDTSYIEDNWLLIESMVGWIGKTWRMQSTSLWEERSGPHDFVHTKVMQWVAVDRSARMAEMSRRRGQAIEWKKLADTLRADILDHGFSNEVGSFVQYYGAKEVDAALLTLPLYGFIDAKDPRFVSTLSKIEKDLMISDGLLLRYRQDFLGVAAHPFTLLSAWLARVYLRAGKKEKAANAIKRLEKVATDLMLIPEHYDYQSGEPRGNIPQLFPHAGIMHAIAELNDPKLYQHALK